MSHFTWWGLIVLALFCSASVFSRLGRAVAITALALASTIMLGTIAMSIYECKMLRATLQEVGGTKYIIGNWAMHYYPVLRISLSGAVDYRGSGPVRQHLAAIAIIVVSFLLPEKKCNLVQIKICIRYKRKCNPLTHFSGCRYTVRFILRLRYTGAHLLSRRP